MRAARKVIFPATPRPDWELWGYRVLLVAGSVAWLSWDHIPEITRWLQRDWHGLVFGCLPVMLACWWIDRRRPRWFESAILLAFALIASAALLFPVFVAPRRDGLRSSCSSNLKQLALASLQYAVDFDDRLPPMEVRWTDSLDPYIKHGAIFRCPGDKQHRMPQWDPNNPPPVTYSLNPYLRGRKLTAVPRPAEVILAWCGDAAGPVMRHNDGCNYAYADGHVKWIAADKDPGIWNPWEPAP